ncbi:zf-HC2 domain-containing protein [Nocardia sp. GCM10030253]|uniref:zf-HC2 domain-containing protein n=1 Tax=Nocardia sp. GCM10030253 TaxID=3273404 RepID=UPI00362DA5F1
MAEMNCDEFVEVVTAYMEGSLDESNERRFIDHLGSCDGCDSYLDQIRDTIRALREQPRAALTRESRDALLAAFRSRSK